MDRYCVRCGLYEPQRTCRFVEVLGVCIGAGVGVAVVSYVGFVLLCGPDRAQEITDVIQILAFLTWIGIILPTALVSYGLECFKFYRKKNRRA